MWAVDTRHLPLYWFPRECPRGTFWATASTARADTDLLEGSSRVHLVERAWLERIRAARVLAYELPAATFTPDPDVGGYWLSRDPVTPIGLVALGDLVARHDDSGIELRVVRSLCPIWNRVVGSTLEYSGIRLHNAQPAKSR